jgi:hypothetical protein
VNNRETFAPPLHGGGQGFESPRLHSEMCGFAGKTYREPDGHYSRVKLLAAVDTKYKVLEPTEDHAGLSQADFYQVYAYARAGKEKYHEIYLLYPATEAPVEGAFDQDTLTLRVRQFDPRKIYDPHIGNLNVNDTVKELGRALSRCT